MPISYPYGFWNLSDHRPTVRTNQLTIPLTPVLLIPLSLNRLRFQLLNFGPNVIYIGPDSTVSAANGFRIASVGSFATDTPYELWAIAAVAATPIATLIEEMAQVG